ncbi:MAG: PA domain-containing protein [Egibacteraceae bacterium]
MVINLLLAGVAWAHPEEAEETARGRLPGKVENVELVGRAMVSNAGLGRIADVNVFGTYAYLGAFSEPECENGGVYVLDISDPANPRELPDAFIPAAEGSFVGEGVQILDVKTPAFTGQVLLHNNEICDEEGEGKGGLSLWDVTDPRDPQPLAENVGDVDGSLLFDPEDPEAGPEAVHMIHSAFGWIDGDRAYAVIVDDEEPGTLDIDIMDITDPRAPTLIAETGLAEFDEARQDPPPHGDLTLFHDVVVEEVDGHMLMLASYWDAGWVILNVDDPANPVFLRDTDYAEVEPFAERLSLPKGLVPEGNAHQAEFTNDHELFFATDEDFDPFRAQVQITSGPNAGSTFEAANGSEVLSLRPDRTLEGPTAYVGDACDPLPAAGGEGVTALIERAPCPFQQKADNVRAAGYAGGIVFSNERPDCEALIMMEVTSDIPFVLITRSAGLAFLGVDAVEPCTTAEPEAGAPSADVLANAIFDGWGYVHLYDAQTMEEIGLYAIPESLDPASAEGFGDLSVHEVATDPKRSLAYFSYYAGGFRVVEYSREGIREVGAYIDPELGNNLWGVQVHEINGEQYVLASDRDTGLWIFRYTGP